MGKKMEVKKGDTHGERLQAERRQSQHVNTKRYRIWNKFGMEKGDINNNMTTMWTRMWLYGLDTSWLSMEKAQKHAQRNDMWKKMKILRRMLENGKHCTTINASTSKRRGIRMGS